MSRYHSIQIPEEQVKRLQQGDRQALAMIYQSLSGVVYGTALRILSDPHSASGVTQDTFLQVMEKANQLKEPAAFVGWVRSVTINQCLMRIRRPDYTQNTEWLAEQHRAHDQQPTIRPEEFGDIERALKSLAPQTRMVLWMHEVEGFTHSEIGRLFGRSQSFSKSQLARGFAELKKNFHGDQHDPRRCANEIA